jgi:hypothetical protein
MRGAPVTVEIPHHLIVEARLYAGLEHPGDAVCHVLLRYADLIAEVRQLRRRLDEFDRETAVFDEKLEALQALCQAILDL